MARRLFFVEAVRRGEAELRGEEARHLSRVLRVEPGRLFEISDNQDLYLAEVIEARKEQVWFRVVEKMERPLDPVGAILLASLIRFERFEWMLEKATELGVRTVTPIVAARSEKGLERAALRRLQRWRKIVLESAQQARRPRLPELAAPQALAPALFTPADHRYLLDESPAAPPLAALLPRQPAPCGVVALLAGPEGGWTDPERARAVEAGWQAVSLGPNILRSETAALAALAVVNATWLASAGGPVQA